MFKKLLVGAAVATSLFALSAPASATLTNWYLDTDGAGVNAPVLIEDYLDLTGKSYVNNTFTSGTDFSFNEVGNFFTYSADTETVLSPYLTANFVGSGTGTTGGALTFTPGGTLDVYSGAVNIADFILLEGSAQLLANSTLPNGTVSFIFQATSMLSGYFFDQDMNDLSIIANSGDGLVLGFATTNVISLANGTRTISDTLISSYNTAFDTDIVAPVANLTTDLYLSNNGQFRLSEVPEPSMLSLLGLALVGFGFTTRRKAKATDKAA